MLLESPIFTGFFISQSCGYVSLYALIYTGMGLQYIPVVNQINSFDHWKYHNTVHLLKSILSSSYKCISLLIFKFSPCLKIMSAIQCGENAQQGNL